MTMQRRLRISCQPRMGQQMLLKQNYEPLRRLNEPLRRLPECQWNKRIWKTCKPVCGKMQPVLGINQVLLRETDSHTVERVNYSSSFDRTFFKPAVVIKENNNVQSINTVNTYNVDVTPTNPMYLPPNLVMWPIMDRNQRDASYGQRSNDSATANNLE